MSEILASSHECDDAPDGVNHDLSTAPLRDGKRTMVCKYCKRTREDIVEEIRIAGRS